MKVVMIGHSGVGKTTYMAAAYQALHNGPLFFRKQDYCGFGVTSHNSDDHKRLIKLGKMVASGNYPTATDQRSQYSFQLTFSRPGFIFKNHDNLKSFVWSDYRGGALNERISESQEADSLQEDLSNADAIIVFADVNALQTRKADRIKREIKRLSIMLTDAATRQTRSLPVVIAFTKSDLLPPGGCVSEDLFAQFGSMIDVMSASDKIISTHVCIACGRRPLNVCIPLLFVLSWHIRLQHYHIGEKIKLLEKSSNEATIQSDKYASTAAEWGGLNGFWNSTVCTFTGEKSILKSRDEHKEKALKLVLKAQQKQQEISPLVEPANRALEICGNLPLIGRHPLLVKK